MEIERKFLVKDLKDLDLTQYKSKHIVQDYLYSDIFTIVRKRKITVENKTKYTYTIKTDKTNYSVNELEKDITEQEYSNIPINPDNTQLSKTRYIIPYEKYKIELDVFENEYEGVIFAEVEFPNEDEAISFKIPKWFDKELSSSITNSMMATMDKDDIKKRLEENY